MWLSIQDLLYYLKLVSCIISTSTDSDYDNLSDITLDIAAVNTYKRLKLNSRCVYNL
jgi:hypothetical protein